MIRIVGRLAFKYLNRRLMLKRVRGGLSIYLLLLASGSLFHLPATAQFTAYSNEFLNIGAGARGMAMGDAQVASVSDGTAGYWNPAALAGMALWQISARSLSLSRIFIRPIIFEEW